MKKILALLACVYLTVHLTACTSEEGDTGGLPGPDDQAQVGTGETGGLEPIPGQDPSKPRDEFGEFDNDPNPPAPGGQPNAEATPPPMESDPVPPGTGEAMLPPGGEPGIQPEATPAPVIVQATPTPEPIAPPPPEVQPAPPADGAPPVKPHVAAVYKKVETVPFRREDQLLNAVYVARPNDTYKSIAQKIFSDGSKQKQLKKLNPNIMTAHTGDKIYYNSPQRPNDDQVVKTFYEDLGMPPEAYLTREGDDLKKVAKELLGFDNAWKEVWATNTVESKGKLTAGQELRYWKAADTGLPPKVQPLPTPMPIAQATPEPTPEMAPPPPTPIPEATPVQAAVTPAPTVEPPPPPPPPKPIVSKPTPVASPTPIGGIDEDTLYALAGGALFLIGVTAIIVVRKRKQQSEMAAAFNDTQVGT